MDWRHFYASRRTRRPAVDPRRRLRIGVGAFAAVLALLMGRIVQLEISQGEAFREAAARPLVRQQSLPAPRGRILARGGEVLACDRQVSGLAVQYRYLEEPPNARWLRLAARSRLPRAERKDAARLAAAESQLREERRQLGVRLRGLCGWTVAQWEHRAREIQARVERIAEGVNRRRLESAAEEGPADEAGGGSPQWSDELARWLRSSMVPAPLERITVAEELDYHVVVDDVPLEVVAEVEAHTDRYPGVRIVGQPTRSYPGGTLACHVLGHLGKPEETGQQEAGEDLVGRMGIEGRCERLLRGRRGKAAHWMDRSGRSIQIERLEEPVSGRDLVLTLDAALQRTAEELLAAALERRAMQSPGSPPSGGAIVVMDCRNGALLACASAPAFDPNRFTRPDPGIGALLSDPAHALLDRAARMAIAPGSVFKTVTAVALLESLAADPSQPYDCRGYLDTPDRLRCTIYRQSGVGHGPTDLAMALAQSCNVYFVHHATRMGPQHLVEWAMRLGVGRPTGLDLPESAGTLPTPENLSSLEGRAWSAADTRLLAIGQGSLTMTPMQAARIMAAVGNGGRLVTPHLVQGLGLTERPELADAEASGLLPALPPPQPIPGLTGATLASVREGLRRVVSHPLGTANAALGQEAVLVSGKTGTAETAIAGEDHSWFAGYAPSDEPKVALVVALQRSGNADITAVPVVKRLVLRMRQLGIL